MTNMEEEVRLWGQDIARTLKASAFDCGLSVDGLMRATGLSRRKVRKVLDSCDEADLRDVVAVALAVDIRMSVTLEVVVPATEPKP